uniref:pentapeptide repeat-containing protein n=1 Tax=Leptolyngbya sp. CCY15150 TaxID=2767772 RepID=UPI00194F844C
ANLFNANLFNANLTSANLFNANLSSTNLSGADLRSADLTSAYLSSADLRSANLSSADLSSADLSSANLSNADLSNANLNEILWNGSTHWAGAQGLHAALNVPESLAQTPRFKAAVVLSQGMDGVKQGHVLAAIQAYQEAQTIDTGLEIDAWVWNLLCQFGSLHGQSAAVVFAGDKAVALGDWVGFRETRGIARALTDDLAGASEDFQAVVTAIEAEEYYRGEKAKQRQEWAKALQMGQNPFTPEVLEALRKKEGLGNDGAASEAVEENG